MLKFLRKKIGIIGFGNMGASIAAGLKDKYRIYIFDKDKEKTSLASGFKLKDDIAGLVDDAEVIILAVKPQDFKIVLGEIKDRLKNNLVISIAAGITTVYIEKHLGAVKVVRAMPNIGLKIKRAQTSLCKGVSALKKDLVFAKKLFSLLGQTWIINEEMMDAATAISGSGPGYIYYDMEINKYSRNDLSGLVRQSYVQRLKKAAEAVGFNEKTALGLASGIVDSTISLYLKSGIAAGELRRQVASKGGTTEAALKVLIAGGPWEEAALEARKRAQELSMEWL
jgi:pyrroline-5-carboxylate reductase